MISKYGELVLVICITIAMTLLMSSFMIMVATLLWDLPDTWRTISNLMISGLFMVLFLCMGILVVMLIDWIRDWRQR